LSTVAVIPSAGIGRRMKSSTPKQYMTLLRKPVLYWTLLAFENCKDIDSVVLVVPRGEVMKTRDELVDMYEFSKVTKVVLGGRTRQGSVYKGLQAIEDSCDVVCIHDGVRPLIEPSLISRAVLTAKNFGAGCVAVKATDTIKQISDDGFIIGTPNRRYLYSAQTPQAFEFNLILDAHRVAESQNLESSDDSSLVERIGGRVVIVEGSYENIKITNPGDIPVAEMILKNRKNVAKG
jgi:2-C-methyl-D-erythritol 4-phosphate cytidylyltransferase